MTTPRDSYAWNYRELATLLTRSESLAECGFEPPTIGSMRKNLTIELYVHDANAYGGGIGKTKLDKMMMKAVAKTTKHLI